MSDRKELTEKVRDLVTTRYAGDWGAAFSAYCHHDDKLEPDELITVLKDAGFGSVLTRRLWASRIISVMDYDDDGKVSRTEFMTVFM